MLNIEDVLKELSEKRKIFHSEADFKHSLAWEIHKKHPDLNIRLEKREKIDGEEVYIDIFIYKNDKVFALELKYKTKMFNKVVSNENYQLKDQSAQNCGRYDFCKDIERLEKILKKYPNGTGFAILLTNDASYWKEPRRSDTVDKDFRIHEGRTIKGTLKWKRGTSKGTIRGRENPIKLTGKYNLHWKNYSNLNGNNGEFRYLLVEVKSDGETLNIK